MGLFDDVNQFLETRLEEFLRNNPHLELQALEEQLREQERDTQRLIAQLQSKEKQLKDEILAVAEDIQKWHARISKAKAAGRMDLAQAAQEREAALLRQGNQLWGQMEGAKQRLIQSQELLTQIKQRHQELKRKAAEVKTKQAQAQSSTWDTQGWNQGNNYTSSTTNRNLNDPLEQQFQSLETDDELKQMKRKMGL